MLNKKFFIKIFILFWILGLIIAAFIFRSAVRWKEPVEPMSIFTEISSDPIPGEFCDHSVAEISIVEAKPRYGFTDEDVYILAQLLCGNEDYNGDGEYDFVYAALHDEMDYYEMSKVLCVVMNRVRNDSFPDTVSEVIFQKGQFADDRRIDTEPADIAIEKIREWCEAYDRGDLGAQSIPEDHFYFVGDGVTNTTSTTWR
jgi:hypothetical protein